MNRVDRDADALIGCGCLVWAAFWTALIVWAIVTLVNHFAR